ncbi:MAG TPA: tRNA 2-thiouridine(34) synthase MnmA [Candidatus Saccharimonadales bacterium]
MAKKVYVGLSGGVDSSVTAALLLGLGYDVTAVYMKNWSQDLPGFVCPWKEDYQDAKRVAVKLGIPFKMYDFEKEYRSKVVDYMIDGYKAGLTPNPDIMCNQEVKFKLFLETALEDGADMIATGHYARIGRGLAIPKGLSPAAGSGPRPVAGSATLLAGLDKNKDQSYFLYRVNEDALAKTLMPIGDYKKSEVRDIAKKLGLNTAEKKDSQGICFVGKVGIKEFLQQFVKTMPGSILDQNGQIVGEHDGALFYTIGQRQGLGVGGGLPYYVVGKDMDKNEVYVTTNLQDDRLWHAELELTSAHWINGEPSTSGAYHVRTRYRAELIEVTKIQKLPNGNWQLTLKDEVRAITPGQSAVLYDADRVVGGGIVL